MPLRDMAGVLSQISAQPDPTSLSVDELRKNIDRFGDYFQLPSGLEVIRTELGGVPCDRLTFSATGPVLLYLHGGGYVFGSAKSHRHVAGHLAVGIEGSVYALDYRLAPEFPFPAAIEDAAAAYRALVAANPADDLAIAGDSAGGGLAFALLIAAREEGLPLPFCAVGLSPWVTLFCDNPTFDTLAEIDPILSRKATEFFADHYTPLASRANPLVSPLFGDLSGFPPVLLQVGSREVFLGDVTEMNTALTNAGVVSELEVWPEMFHAWHLYWPLIEHGKLALEKVAAFIRKSRPALAA